MMRWRGHEPAALVRTALPALGMGLAVTVVAIALGVREPMPSAVVFGAAWALASNAIVTWRGFRAGWKHGVAYLGHAGFAVMLIGIVASSGYGREVQVQLPHGAARNVLGYQLTYEGMRKDAEGKDHVVVAVQSARGSFEALPAMYWSEFNQGYMKKPHIERFLTYDLYLSPLDMVGGDGGDRGVWFEKGETKEIGGVRYTFVDFDVQGMGTPRAHIAAQLRVETGGRTVPARPVVEIGGGTPNPVPDYLPGGGSVSIVNVDAQNGRVALELPGTGRTENGDVLALSVSTKPLISLVWLGAIIMLASAFMSVIRRALDVKRSAPAA